MQKALINPPPKIAALLSPGLPCSPVLGLCHLLLASRAQVHQEEAGADMPDLPTHTESPASGSSPKTSKGPLGSKMTFPSIARRHHKKTPKLFQIDKSITSSIMNFHGPTHHPASAQLMFCLFPP